MAEPQNSTAPLAHDLIRVPFVHLVGSVDGDSVEHVMHTVLEQLPGRLRMIPDGELGIRSNFVLWQAAKVWPEEIMTPTKNRPNAGAADSSYKLTAEHLPKSTGYAEYAIQSYETFKDLKSKGIIPKDVRFLVCLPSPVSVVGMLIKAEFRAVAEELYERILLADLEIIQEKIPHQDLAIQWDILVEIMYMEKAYGEKREGRPWFWAQLEPYFSPIYEGFSERINRLASRVHGDVPMGLHLCYGDAQHEHFVQPIDAGFLARATKITLDSVSRRVDWVHMPVPKSRTDEAYFEPLRSVVESLNGTSLILGLVHSHDLEGTQQRLRAAQAVLIGVQFGIATECGMIRTPKDEISSIYEICRACSIPVGS